MLSSIPPGAEPAQPASPSVALTYTFSPADWREAAEGQTSPLTTYALTDADHADRQRYRERRQGIHHNGGRPK